MNKLSSTQNRNIAQIQGRIQHWAVDVVPVLHRCSQCFTFFTLSFNLSLISSLYRQNGLFMWRPIILALPASGGGTGMWLISAQSNRCSPSVSVTHQGWGFGRWHKWAEQWPLSSSWSHTSFSRHVSVSARSIWWPGAPAGSPCAFKAVPDSHFQPFHLLYMS